MAVITIFGGSYCHLDAIATGVSQKLNYPFIDDGLIEETSRRFDVARDKLERAFYGPEPMLNKITHERQKNITTAI